MKRLLLCVALTVGVLQAVEVSFTNVTTTKKYNLVPGEEREYTRLNNNYQRAVKKNGKDSHEAVAAFVLLSGFFDGLDPIEEDEDLDYEEMFGANSEDEDEEMFGPTILHKSEKAGDENIDLRDRKNALMVERARLDAQYQQLRSSGYELDRDLAQKTIVQNQIDTLKAKMGKIAQELKALVSSEAGPQAAAAAVESDYSAPVDLGQEEGVRAPIAPKMMRLVDYDDESAHSQGARASQPGMASAHEDLALQAALEASRATAVQQAYEDDELARALALSMEQQ